MLEQFRNIMFAAMIFPAALFNTGPGLGEKPDTALAYRCEIAGYYTHLRDISEEFGNVLLSEDYDRIFPASVNAVASFDEMSGELKSMQVPGEMQEAHDAFLKSISAYRESADLIRVVIGTALGKYEETGADLQGMIDKSVYEAAVANEYLARSLTLHGEIFQLYAEGESTTGQCGKYVAGNFAQ
jgi:hypothetical protein